MTKNKHHSRASTTHEKGAKLCFFLWQPSLRVRRPTLAPQACPSLSFCDIPRHTRFPFLFVTPCPCAVAAGLVHYHTTARCWGQNQGSALPDSWKLRPLDAVDNVIASFCVSTVIVYSCTTSIRIDSATLLLQDNLSGPPRLTRNKSSPHKRVDLRRGKANSATW